MTMSRNGMRMYVPEIGNADRAKWIACIAKWNVSHRMRINVCTM